MDSYTRSPRFPKDIDEVTWRRWLLELGAHADIVDAHGWHVAFADEVQPARFSAGVPDMRLFVVTFLHETAMLVRLSEDMSYSAERICVVWPHRFPTEEAAKPFEHNPRALANKVYGGRMGNTLPDDGYDFRGRAAGITGRTNYTWLGDRWGQDLIGIPSLLEQPHFALDGSFHVWENLVPDKDLSDQVKVRKDYNGALIGMQHCADLEVLCRKVVMP